MITGFKSHLQSNKIGSIEAMRFLFMLIICLWHYQGVNGFFSHGYLGVEYFFILSGILLFKSSQKQHAPTPIDYTCSKIKRFMPQYLTAMFLMFIVSLFETEKCKTIQWNIRARDFWCRSL